MRISEDTGATLETVELAKKAGGDPRDWKLHETVAGFFLHAAEPNNPVRARRFYDSALRLAPKELPKKDRWLMEEGIGISWLMQDQPTPARPHLERGLEIARHPSMDPRCALRVA